MNINQFRPIGIVPYGKAREIGNDWVAVNSDRPEYVPEKRVNKISFWNAY